MPILFVDDDPVMLSSAEAYLRLKGHWVQSAANGKSALTRMKTRPFPRCVVIDQMMEDMRGTDVVAVMRASDEWRHIPAIVLTGLGDGPLDELKGEVKALGNCRLLRKPCEPEELLREIEAAVAGPREAPAS